MAESRTISQVPALAAVSPNARMLVSEPGGLEGTVDLKTLFGKFIATDTATATVADLNAQLGYADKSIGLVFSDPDLLKNGWYRKAGAKGAGMWVQFETLSKATRESMLTLSGNGPPAANLGTAGQFYRDLSKSDEYGPKTANGWGEPRSLIGPPGEAANVFSSIARLKKLDPVRYPSATLANGTNAPVGYAYVAGDFTGRADDLKIVELDTVSLAVGALVRQQADGITYTAPVADAVPADVSAALAQRISILDFIDPLLHQKIRSATLATPLTGAFKKALAQADGSPFGGVIILPAGGYVMDMHVHKLVTDFTRPLTIAGEGRGVTTVWPETAQGITLFAAGRNVMTVRDLTLSSGDGPAPVQAQCGVYIGRLVESPNANNCKFINIEVRGNHSKGAVFSFGAESGFWLNCRFADDDFQSKAVGFVSGEDPGLSGIMFPPNTGTPVTGPNTDNRMVACETYLPFPGAEHMRFIAGAAWQIDGHAFIGGTNDGQRMVVREAVANVFSGRVATTGCHYEVFGTGNVVHWMVGGGSPAFYSVVSEGGIAVVDNGCNFVDFDRTQAANGGPILIAPALTMPALPPSITSGLPIYVFGIVAAHIDWRGRDSNGTVAVFGFAADCTIHAYDARIADAPRSDIPVYSDAKPVSGTFARGQRVTRNYSGALALGDEEGWINTVAGTMGILASVSVQANAGATFGTVDNNGGLAPGQLVSFGGQQRRITAVAGPRVYFLGPIGAAVPAGTPMTFYPGSVDGSTFQPVGIVGMKRAAVVADLATEAALPDVVAKINEILASDRAANQRA